MNVIILCGGLGTRLAEETTIKPKPMVEIGDFPILWHIMKIYSHYGFNDFVLALGYKSEIIKDYFLHYQDYHCDLTIDLKTGNITRHNSHAEGWKVNLVETGLKTMTGGRIKRAMQFSGNEPVMATYGDGVGNINIHELVKFHKKHKKLATMTVVRPAARFGNVELDGNKIQRFSEKTQTEGGWINGGFFVLEPEVKAYIDDDTTIFETTPLQRLTNEGQIMAYKHSGFWQPMDTIRERELLEGLWRYGTAPWKVWS